MISTSIRGELDFRYHYLLATFGGVDKYIRLLESQLTNQSKVNLHVHYLLNHPGKAHIVSPWSMYIKLFNEEGGIYEQDSIVFDEPYSVFNTRGQLLYKVSGHDGYFGESILDRSLVLQSESNNIYYIQYPTYSGMTNTKLLLVNLISLTSPSTNVFVEGPLSLPEIETSQITLRYTETVGQIVYIYHLPSAPVRIPTKEAVSQNPYSDRAIITLDYSDTFTFNPTKSGWITVTRQSGNLEQAMRITNVLGQGVDRFLRTGIDEYVYYLAIGDEVDIITVQNSLGVRSTVPPSLSSSNLINLTAEVSL